MFPQQASIRARKPKQFASDQRKEMPAFCFDRPPSAATTIPITLYHPVFGQFQDDCDNYTPTKEDNAFVLEFSRTMSKFYDGESDRAEASRKLMTNYSLKFLAAQTGSYKTDGDLRYNNFCYAIL